MIFTSKDLIAILLLLQEVISTSTADLLKEYNITEVLRDTIVGIFQSVEPPNATNLIKSIENIEHANIYTYHNHWRFRFRNTRIFKVYSNETRIRYGFHNNTIQICSPRLVVHLSSFVEKEISPKELHTYNIDAEILFINSLLTAIALPNNSRTPFYISPEYIHVDSEIEGISDKNKGALNRIRPLLPLVLRDDMNHNKEFFRKLNQSHGSNPKKLIIMEHPDFLADEDRYYYLIPKFSIGLFHLTNIVVRGLSNFQFLNFIDKPGHLTYTLLIKNIRGDMILENGPETRTLPIGLNFFADSISISIAQGTNQINVEARNYSVVQTKSNIPLEELHSNIMIDCLESAIASSLKPSMKLQRTNRSDLIASEGEIESSIRQMIMAVGKSQ